MEPEDTLVSDTLLTHETLDSLILEEGTEETSVDTVIIKQ